MRTSLDASHDPGQTQPREVQIVEPVRGRPSLFARSGWAALGASLVVGGTGFSAVALSIALGGLPLRDVWPVLLPSIGMLVIGLRVIRFAWKGQERFFVGWEED